MNWMQRQWLKFRKWAITVLAAIGIVIGGIGYGLADDVNLSWTNAQLYEDGTPMPLDEIQETRLYKESFPLGTDVSATARNYALLAAVAPGNQAYLDADQPDGIHCYVATHLATNGTESQYSGEACKVIDLRRAGSPQGLTAN